MASKKRPGAGTKRSTRKGGSRRTGPAARKGEREPLRAGDATHAPIALAAGDPPGSDFLVVGIGASAGGLEALNDLFRNIPRDGMAFIVVQHLAPDHESMLAQLLARNAHIPVVTVEDGVAIERNHIY